MATNQQMLLKKQFAKLGYEAKFKFEESHILIHEIDFEIDFEFRN